jgi:ABC-2 type transport system permease protein
MVRKMARLINSEIFKLRKRFMTWLLAGVMVGLLIFIYLVLFAITQKSFDAGGAQAQAAMAAMKEALGLRFAIPFALSSLSMLGSILAVILTASSVGSEYGWRTIRPLLASSVSRTSLLWAKLISIVIFVLIGMIIAVLVGFLMSLITNSIGGNPIDFSFFTGPYAWDQFVQFGWTFFVIMPFVLMSLMFSILGRSVLPGIAFGVGFLFLEPVLIVPLLTLAGGWVAKIPNYLFSANTTVISNMGSFSESFKMLGRGLSDSTTAPTPAHAFIVLGIYSVAFLVLGFYFFRKRDVTG